MQYDRDTQRAENDLGVLPVQGWMAGRLDSKYVLRASDAEDQASGRGVYARLISWPQLQDSRPLDLT